MNRLTTALSAAATAVFLAGQAFAGAQYVDETGFAASGFDVVAYFDLPQNPAGQSQPAPVPGKATITAEYNSAVFAFSTEANRDAFVADPARYAPQFDGHCAYGVAKGDKVPANPMLWRIVDDKLYLNITNRVVRFWEKDIPGNITLADGNWASIEPDRASDRTIPRFTSPAPIK